MKKQNVLAFSMTAVAVTAAFAMPALAASGSDWAQPAADGIKDLTTTVVTIAGALIGLSIVGYGLWAAANQRIDWSKIWIFLISGLLVTVGPTAIMAWIDKLKS